MTATTTGSRPPFLDLTPPTVIDDTLVLGQGQHPTAAMPQAGRTPATPPSTLAGLPTGTTGEVATGLACPQ